MTAHLGTLPTSPCKGEVGRAAGGRGSHLLLKRSVTRGTIDIEGFPPTSIASQILTPSPTLPLSGRGRAADQERSAADQERSAAAHGGSTP
jgi:hypothetical protein